MNFLVLCERTFVRLSVRPRTIDQELVLETFLLFPVYSLCDRVPQEYQGIRFLFLIKKTPRHLILINYDLVFLFMYLLIQNINQA